MSAFFSRRLRRARGELCMAVRRLSTARQTLGCFALGYAACAAFRPADVEAVLIESLRSIDLPRPDTVLAEELTASAFFEYVRANQPLVIRGMARSWPALTRWTDDWLDENMGSLDVRVERVPGRPDRPLAPACGAAPREIFASFAKGWSAASTPFATFLRAHRDPRTSGLAFIAETALPPELSQDAPLPEFASFLGEPEHVQLWYGGATETPAHTDTQENLLVQVDGERQIRLASARVRRGLGGSSRLARYFRRALGLAPTLPDNFLPVSLFDEPLTLPFVDDQFGSPRHMDDDGWSPAIMEVTLREGDALFVPSFWYHHIRANPGPPPSCRSVAVNIWYTGASAAFSAVMACIQEGRCRV